jgi:formylglycine-generating enzyme required for sulfatase activity
MQHTLGQKLCGGVAVALAVCVGLAMARRSRPAVVAVGWYGEIIPAGVHKGTVPGEYLHDKDQAVMVYVLAGVFVRGTPASQAQALAAQFGEYFAVETPQRAIDLDAYYVDKFEVTNQQYAQFLAVFASAGRHYVHSLGICIFCV